MAVSRPRFQPIVLCICAQHRSNWHRLKTKLGEIDLRTLLMGLAVMLAACSTSRAESPLTSIDVVYHPETLYYTITDNGPARFVGFDSERVFEFHASHEDFSHVAELLQPLEAEGLTCSAPTSTPGYIIFRRGDQERRVEMHTSCYADAERPLAINTNRAWQWMADTGRARYVAPSIPDPTSITLRNMYWGNERSSWVVPRGGEGRFTEGDRVVTFDITTETFDRIREIFRPYEGTHFECNRVIADGPYGFIIWSSEEGREDQRTRWDAGCLTGDAGDLFGRIDAAVEILVPLREAAAAP
jgi:hypothetical protein